MKCEITDFGKGLKTFKRRTRMYNIGVIKMF